MLGPSETLVVVVDVDGAVEEEHAARQQARTNAGTSRIMTVLSATETKLGFKLPHYSSQLCEVHGPHVPSLPG